MNESRRLLVIVIGFACVGVALTIAAFGWLSFEASAPSPNRINQAINLVGYAAVLYIVVSTSAFYGIVERLLSRMRENNERIQAIVEHVVDGILTCSQDGTILTANKAACGLFGYRSGRLLGANVAMLFSASHPPLEESGFYMFLRSSGMENVGQVFEAVGLRADGGSFPMAVAVSDMRVEGRLRYTMVIHDLTARVAQEEALRRSQGELERRVRERMAELEAEIAQRRAVEESRRATLAKLQEALARIKVLGGLIPICASCKKVRDDRGYWKQIEVYIRDHSHADFSHGICPECAAKLYPDLADPEPGKENGLTSTGNSLE